jgi:DNA-binding transcriptional MocR family regulator
VQLFRFVKRSQAYQSLSLPARCALIELLDRYTGINNGMIGLGVRTLADALNCSQSTATRALRELDDSGLVRATTVGFWRGKRATEWRLTFYRCDKTGDLPNKSWAAREVHQRSTKGSSEKYNDALRLASKAQMPKSSINGKGHRFTREAHIDIYHGDTDLDARTSEVERE